MDSRRTHYDVLGVSQAASHEELKAAYKSAVLRTHPDKVTDFKLDPQNATTFAAKEEEFIRIQEAWEVLSSASKRKEYDMQMELDKAKQQLVANETVMECNMIPLEAEDGEVCLSWPCRCGGDYVVYRDEFEASDELFVPCDTCSLYLRVLHNI